MTDLTPIPQPDPQTQPGLPVEAILELEGKLRENKAAQLRGDPPPHAVSREQLAAAINGIRRQRGTMNFAEKTGDGKKGAKKGSSKIIEVDLDGL